MTKRKDTDELLSDIDGQLGDVVQMSVAEARQARTAGAVERVIQTASREHTCICQRSYRISMVTYFNRDLESGDPGRWFWREGVTRDREAAWLSCYNIPRDDATGSLLMALTGVVRNYNMPDFWDVQQLFLDDLEIYGVPPEPDVVYEGYPWLVPTEDTSNRSEFDRLNDYATQIQQLQQDQHWRNLPPVQVQRGPVTFNPPPSLMFNYDPGWQQANVHRIVATMQPEQVEQLRALNPGHPAFDPESWALFDGANRVEVNPGEVAEEDGDNPTVEIYVYGFDVPDDPLPF